jgi:hypothetical protein
MPLRFCDICGGHNPNCLHCGGIGFEPEKSTVLNRNEMIATLRNCCKTPEEFAEKLTRGLGKTFALDAQALWRTISSRQRG